MYLRAAGTLVAVGMPGGTAALNVPIVLLIAKACASCTDGFLV